MLMLLGEVCGEIGIMRMMSRRLCEDLKEVLVFQRWGSCVGSGSEKGPQWDGEEEDGVVSTKGIM